LSKIFQFFYIVQILSLFSFKQLPIDKNIDHFFYFKLHY